MAKYHDWITPAGLAKVEGWARDGLIDEQIAGNMGISCATLHEWKNRFPEFSEALKKGKEVADLEVENALFRRACGYKTIEVKHAPRLNKETGETALEVISETEKEIPPDVTACIFWLKNRKPEQWRDGKALDVSGKLARVGDFEIVVAPEEGDIDLQDY